MDLEMTGLDPAKDTILEIACAITDKDLNLLDRTRTYVIRHSESLLLNMDDWNKSYHIKTGLYSQVLKSKVTMKQAERELLEYIKQYAKPQKNLLAGASIHIDKLFLQRRMPKLHKYLKWQILDVATVRNLGYKWYGIEPFPKNDVHRAHDDVIESIEELKYFREAIFKS